MKFCLPNAFTIASPSILRSCGYFAIIDKQTHKKSFIRKLTAQRYPRFHAYLEENDKEITIDLHLDQAKPVYSGQTAHRADYDGKQIETELVKIFDQFKKFQT